jgi:H+/Cl- antiporter ClcA
MVHHVIVKPEEIDASNQRSCSAPRSCYLLKVQLRLRILILSLLTGLAAGVAATAFLVLLKLATEYRDAHPLILWLLPIAGFFVGWIYNRWGGAAGRGHNLILDEIHKPSQTVPLRMAPLVFIGTLVTHLFGGSAGREGTVVQMGACLGDNLSKIWKLPHEDRRRLLVAGAGAGFGAAIGAPVAGFIFGMEVVNVGRFRFFAVVECALASVAAWLATRWLSAPHTHFDAISAPSLNGSAVALILIAGVLFGLASRLFVWLTHQVEGISQKLASYPPLRTAGAGLMLALLYQVGDLKRFAGLGLPEIQSGLHNVLHWQEPLTKALFTALTIGSGFKGGEFIPLVFIGTTLGSCLAVWSPSLLPILSGSGFAAVFAGAANTPIACTIMAVELFGVPILPYALVACFLSQYFAGIPGIYKAQRVEQTHFKVEKIFLKRS